MAAKKVAQLLLAQVSESRSPLYRWLRQNYTDIKSVIDAQRRPAWQALARTAAASGQGNPSRQAVRKAWLRLEADMTAKGGLPKSRPVAPGTQQPETLPTPAPAPASPSPKPAWPVTDRKPRYTFKTASFKTPSEKD